MSSEQVDGRSRRWDDHKELRRDQVLDAAIATLGDIGELGGVQDIADRAQLPRSVVYRLFKDRDDLEDQLRRRILGGLMTVLAPTLTTPEATFEDSIRNAVDAYVGWIVDNPNLHTYLGAAAARQPTSGPSAVSNTRAAIANQAARVIAEELDKLDADTRFAEPLGFALIGMVDSTVNRWLSRSPRPITPAELSEFLRSSAWQIIDSTLQRSGIRLDPQTPVAKLPRTTRTKTR